MYRAGKNDLLSPLFNESSSWDGGWLVLIVDLINYSMLPSPKRIVFLSSVWFMRTLWQCIKVYKNACSSEGNSFLLVWYSYGRITRKFPNFFPCLAFNFPSSRGPGVPWRCRPWWCYSVVFSCFLSVPLVPTSPTINFRTKRRFSLSVSLLFSPSFARFYHSAPSRNSGFIYSWFFFAYDIVGVLTFSFVQIARPDTLTFPLEPYYYILLFEVRNQNPLSIWNGFNLHTWTTNTTWVLSIH